MINNKWYEEPSHGSYSTDILYRKRHERRPSFQYAIQLINSLDGQSVIDVGSMSLGLLEHLDPKFIKLTALDIRKPRSFGIYNKNISFIHADFLKANVSKYDIVVCLEVLEHVRPDLRRTFAQKLLAISNKHVVISIPYNWDNSDGCSTPHEGFNESNILEWFFPHYPDSEMKHDKYYTAYYKV